MGKTTLELSPQELRNFKFEYRRDGKLRHYTVFLSHPEGFSYSEDLCGFIVPFGAIFYGEDCDLVGYVRNAVNAMNRAIHAGETSAVVQGVRYKYRVDWHDLRDIKISSTD